MLSFAEPFNIVAPPHFRYWANQPDPTPAHTTHACFGRYPNRYSIFANDIFAYDIFANDIFAHGTERM